MSDRLPDLRTVPLAEAEQEWMRLVEAVSRGEARLLVETNGQPLVGIISAADLRRFLDFEAERRERFRALEASWAAFDDVPPEEVEREVAKALGEVREESRQQAPRTAPTR
jgi:hypothetical protein